MGNYAHCWFDELLLGTTKDEIDADLISLFSPNDKVVLSPPIEMHSPHVLHHKEWLLEDPTSRMIYYAAELDVVQDRLEILGYDLDTAEHAFCSWAKRDLEAAFESIREWESKGGRIAPLIIDDCRNDIAVLEELTPATWIETLRLIRTRGVKKDYFGRYERHDEPGLLGHMLNQDWHGVPGDDILVALRMGIEACPAKMMIYDLSDLVWGNDLEYTADYVLYGHNIPVEEYRKGAKTVVLTEGKSDAWILNESLRVLFPHLVSYFSILDFGAAKYGGGVGNLANVVKALSGADLANNLVAVFDNDTASSVACKTLIGDLLPSNVAIVRLPDMELLESYPTLGPDGEVNCNINGVAASIELYLGEDILQIDDGRLMPVQWTGFDRGLRQYQGEILDKDLLHERFRKKVARAQVGAGSEWDSLRRVWQVIFRAFRRKRRRAIIDLATERHGW